MFYHTRLGQHLGNTSFTEIGCDLVGYLMGWLEKISFPKMKRDTRSVERLGNKMEFDGYKLF